LQTNLAFFVIEMSEGGATGVEKENALFVFRNMAIMGKE